MIDGNSKGMNQFIPHHLDDMVYFYARRIVKEHGSNWIIYVAPNACLVNLRDRGDGLPTVEDLRQGVLQTKVGQDKAIFEGRVLFSGGIILTINGKILMLFRDKEAPVAPLKWTSPAGRCDREPLLTALKEFYEEVILFDKISGKPVFVSFENEAYFEEVKKIYSRTLKRKGFMQPVEEWIFFHADVGGKFGYHLQEVRTYFGFDEESGGSSGEEVFTGKFFTFFDEEGNTLEMQFLASIMVPPEIEARMAFCDGEFERTVRLFTEQEFMLMDESSLVPTMVYFRNEVLKRRSL